MKRWLIIAAVFLLAGAVVNVAVAWGCAAWVPVDMAMIPASEEFTQLLTRIPPDHPGEEWIPHKDLAVSFSGVGTYQEMRVAWTEKERDRVARSTSKRSYGMNVFSVRSGLPLRSLQGIRAKSGFVSWVHGGLLTPRWMRVKARFLPVIPIWPGFAVNTLFYAALLWSPFVLRRFIRVKRGLCPSCGYDLRHGEHDACPECGRLLSVR